MNIEEIFEKSKIQKYREDVDQKNFKGRQKTNKVSIEKLSYSEWLKEEFKSMIDNTELKIEELHTFILENDIISEQLRNQLQILMDSNYHQAMYPVISRFDFSKPYALDNILVTSSKKNRDEWNQHIASNRTSFDFDKKGVIQIDLKTGTELNRFPSISEAKKYLGIVGHSTYITDCCKNIRSEAHGFKWSFLKKQEESTIF